MCVEFMWCIFGFHIDQTNRIHYNANAFHEYQKPMFFTSHKLYYCERNIAWNSTIIPICVCAYFEINKKNSRKQIVFLAQWRAGFCFTFYERRCYCVCWLNTHRKNIKYFRNWVSPIPPNTYYTGDNFSYESRIQLHVTSERFVPH